jgi:hypothetical protein
VRQGPRLPRTAWLISAVQGLDIGWRDLISWAMGIGRGTWGAVSLSDLRDMEAPVILTVIDEFNRMAQEEKERRERAREE